MFFLSKGRVARLAPMIATFALLPAAAASAQDPVLDRILALPDQSGMTHSSSAGSTTAALPDTDAGTLGTTSATAPEQIAQPAQPTTQTQPAQPQTQAPAQPQQPAVTPKKPLRTGTTCRGKRVRTCLTYRQGKLVKRCVARHGHRRCTRPAGAHAASLSWVGWLNGITEVGKILSVTANDRSSGCTGTVVARSLVLTAAHCVYTSGVGYHKEIHFVPGAKQNGTSYTMPYGRWDATRWWVPSGYQTSGDQSLDYALIEIAPQSGRGVGDVVGTYGISYGQSAFASGRTYLVGYPASGWFAADGRNGFSQYACDSTYDSNQQVGSGYRLWSACYMNRGASGGPWFVPTGGSWRVAGVNSTCDGNYVDATHYCDPWATRLSTAYFDDRIVQFWNSVATIRGTNS